MHVSLRSSFLQVIPFTAQWDFDIVRVQSENEHPSHNLTIYIPYPGFSDTTSWRFLFVTGSVAVGAYGVPLVSVFIIRKILLLTKTHTKLSNNTKHHTRVLMKVSHFLLFHPRNISFSGSRLPGRASVDLLLSHHYFVFNNSIYVWRVSDYWWVRKFSWSLIPRVLWRTSSQRDDVSAGPHRSFCFFLLHRPLSSCDPSTDSEKGELDDRRHHVYPARCLFPSFEHSPPVTLCLINRRLINHHRTVVVLNIFVICVMNFVCYLWNVHYFVSPRLLSAPLRSETIWAAPHRRPRVCRDRSRPSDRHANRNPDCPCRRATFKSSSWRSTVFWKRLVHPRTTGIPETCKNIMTENSASVWF